MFIQNLKIFLPNFMQDEDDIEGADHQAKRLKISSDAFQDTIGNEELSLFGSTPNNSDSAQVVSLTWLEFCRIFC